MCFKKLISFLLFIACTTFAKAQSANTNSLDSFSAKLITNIRATEKQRAYLVTDKSVYRAGEYIWFKAFLLNTVSQRISTKSNFLFVDVVSDEDKIINRVILDAADRLLNSRMLLPDTLTGGYYWLRAYTTQMAEKDTNDICVKPLYVVGKTNYNKHVIQKKNTANKDEIPTISFYPEGGNILPWIGSTVALHANYKNGAPLPVSGYIKDNHDTVVTQFTTNANGLAKFDFEPSGYRQYRAVINWQGKEVSYALPPFNFFTGQLSVSKKTGGYKLRVLLGDSIYRKEALTYLIAVSKDSVVFASIGKGQYEVNVDEQKLPAGIATFYLFNKDFKLLSERSIYVNANNVQANIATDKNIYADKDKVTLTISITDAAQQVVPSLVAISVSDSVFSSEQQQCNFDNAFTPHSIDNLFLATNNCFNDSDIDLIMLTKNNTFQSVISNNNNPVMADNDSLLYIKGVVLNDKNEPLKDNIVTIISSSGNSFFSTDTTDNAGRFSFPFDKYPDSTQFTFDVKRLNGVKQNAKILLDSPAYPQLHTPLALKKYFTAEPKQTKQRFNVYYNTQFTDDEETKLPPVIVKDERNIPDYDVSKRVSKYSSILTSKDLDGSMGVDVAILKISGLQLLNGFLVMHGPSSIVNGIGPSSEPLLLVEGSDVSSGGSSILTYLHTLNPRDIDFIEVLKEADGAAYGVRGGNGVILINLKNKQQNISGKNNMHLFYVKGVEQPVIFPIVNYDRKNKKNAADDDTRSTLFWNGDFLPAAAGNPTISFYTGNIPATYHVTVTGITIHGDIIHKTISFKSK